MPEQANQHTQVLVATKLLKNAVRMWEKRKADMDHDIDGIMKAIQIILWSMEDTEGDPEPGPKKE